MEDKYSRDIHYAQVLTKYVRMASWIIAALLLVWAGGKIATLSGYRFPWLVWLTSVYTLIYAIWMVFPWVRIRSGKVWKTGMIGYIILSFFFVFLMIGNIMVDASAAGAAGERLGVPGFEGMLIFFSLAQIPGILFERHPEMMS